MPALSTEMTPALSAVGSKPPSMPDDAIEVGLVLGAWGIKGGIRVRPFSRDPETLFASRHWYLRPPDVKPDAKPGPATQAARPAMLHITTAKPQGDSVVATAQELPDRNAAEALQGARIFVSRASFPKVGDGEYYWIDLIGLAVANRQGEALGSVVGLIDTGAHSVLRLRRPDAAEGATGEANERLIPFVAAYIDEVSLAERHITVDWGLDY